MEERDKFSEAESESSSSYESPIEYKTKWQKLEEELTCCFCDELLSDPITIPCLHTFCMKCLQGRIDEMKREFHCFVCKAKFRETKIKNCRVNVSLKYLVSVVKKHNSLLKIHTASVVEPGGDVELISCSQCIEGAPSTMWCLTCEDGETCNECYKSHCRMKIFQRHKVIKLQDFMESPDQVLNHSPFLEHCKYHKNQPVGFYCQNCFKFVCQKCECVSNNSYSLGGHKCDAVDKVYEAEKINLEELQSTLQSKVPNFEAALQNNKAADQELEECIAKEITWIKEQFQVIREVVDKHEKNLLQNLETIKNTGKKYLEVQRINIIQLQDQLTSCTKFISGVLQPCRSGEMLGYCEWIKELSMKITKPQDLDPAYNVNDLSITRGDVRASNVASKLDSLSVHQAFHQPYLPNCTACLMCACIVPVVVKVEIKDKYKLPVPNQLPLLEISTKSFGRDFLQILRNGAVKKVSTTFLIFPK